MRSPRSIAALAALAAPLAAGPFGCDKSSSTAAKPAAEEAPRKLAGVYPENFKCETVTSLEALTTVLGGPVKQLDSAMSVPRGVPHPCNYALDNGSAGATFWTYDIDCRDGMKQRADALFAQYRADSATMVADYNKLSDAGALKNDAGIVSHAPEGAVEVAVGAKALDHHGQGLIFIDDDAPCYVRVVGPDPTLRLELAKLIAKSLTFDNAPMTPRAAPQ